MKPWSQRSIELRSLLNPAFCGEIIRRCIWSYEENSQKKMPYALVYFVLPLILDNNTNSLIPNYKDWGLAVWIQNNPQALINFAGKTRSLTPITLESLAFLLRYSALEIDDSCNMTMKDYRPKSTDDQDNYTRKYYVKSEVIGKWFSQIGDTTTIFSLLGVTP